MKKRKLSKLLKIFIICLIVFIVIIKVLISIYYTKVVDDRLKYVRKLHNKKLLVGLSYEECEEMLGTPMYTVDNAQLFIGGDIYTKLFGLPDWESYKLWVYFDENGTVISTAVKRDQSG